jgi:hypothetical protein
VTTGGRGGRSFQRIVLPALSTVSAGTLLPALVIGGRPVPATGARWTLLVLGEDAGCAIAWHAQRLAAEAVSPIPVPGAAAEAATILVDPQGIVQHVGGGVEESLDVVRDFREGGRAPVAPRAGASSPCSGAGRRRRGVMRARRAAH